MGKISDLIRMFSHPMHGVAIGDDVCNAFDKLEARVEELENQRLQDRVDAQDRRMNNLCSKFATPVSSEKEDFNDKQKPIFNLMKKKPEPSCEHDKGDHWFNFNWKSTMPENKNWTGKSESPTCPFCKKEESLEEVLERAIDEFQYVSSCVTEYEYQAQAVLKWIESRLPEELDITKKEWVEFDVCRGHNTCLKEVKERLGL